MMPGGTNETIVRDGPDRLSLMISQAEYIISARGMHKTYRANGLHVQALRGVDFAARRGTG